MRSVGSLAGVQGLEPWARGFGDRNIMSHISHSHAIFLHVLDLKMLIYVLIYTILSHINENIYDNVLIISSIFSIYSRAMARFFTRLSSDY